MKMFKILAFFAAAVLVATNLFDFVSAGGDKSAKTTVITLAGGGQEKSGYPIPIPIPVCQHGHYGGHGGHGGHSGGYGGHGSHGGW